MYRLRKTIFDGMKTFSSHGQERTHQTAELTERQAREVLKKQGKDLRHANSKFGVTWYSVERGNKVVFNVKRV